MLNAIALREAMLAAGLGLQKLRESLRRHDVIVWELRGCSETLRVNE